MDSTLLLLSVTIVVVIGLAILVLFFIKQVKPKTGLDLKDEMKGFSALYSKGKLTREEMDKIRNTMIKNYGITGVDTTSIPPAKVQTDPVKPDRPATLDEKIKSFEQLYAEGKLTRQELDRILEAIQKVDSVKKKPGKKKATTPPPVESVPKVETAPVPAKEAVEPTAAPEPVKTEESFIFDPLGEDDTHFPSLFRTPEKENKTERPKD